MEINSATQRRSKQDIKTTQTQPLHTKKIKENQRTCEQSKVRGILRNVTLRCSVLLIGTKNNVAFRLQKGGGGWKHVETKLKHVETG